MMATKQFKLPAHRICKDLVRQMGSCLASDRITVDGAPVGFMYREPPDGARDSGWRFLAGDESEAYLGNPDNFGLYDVNTIANYDPEIVPLVDAEIGCAFERHRKTGRLVAASLSDGAVN
jgi:hypothetical protein